MSKRKATSTNSINREELKDLCGMVYAMYMLAGRWKLVILHKLENLTLRYTEIKQRMPNITDRMLTLQLQEMERDGLILRTVYPEVPAKVDYQLTDSARALIPVWQGLEQWGLIHRDLHESMEESKQ